MVQGVCVCACVSVRFISSSFLRKQCKKTKDRDASTVSMVYEGFPGWQFLNLNLLKLEMYKGLFFKILLAQLLS